jgi:hypothetical protein
MSPFSLFSAKVLVCALVAFAPVALLFTGFEVTTDQAVRQAEQHADSLQQIWADSTSTGVVVG